MLSKDAFVARVTLRPCTRLLLSGPGAEPHPLLGVSRDCRLVIKPVLRDVIDAIFSRDPPQSLSTCLHGLLEVSLDWISLTVVFPALFTSNPHASKYRWRPAGRGLKHTVPRSTERLRPVRAAMRVMRPS